MLLAFVYYVFITLLLNYYDYSFGAALEGSSGGTTCLKCNNDNDNAITITIDITITIIITITITVLA